MTTTDMTPAQLATACKKLWDSGWQTRLAEALAVDPSTVRRWVAGTVPVPGPVAVAVRCMVQHAGAVHPALSRPVKKRGR